MKRALLISLGLVILITGLGWWQGRELDSLRAGRDAARARAGVAEPFRHSERHTKRPRPDGADEARRVAADFIAYANEMRALGRDATENPSDELRRRMITQMEAVTNLDSAQFRMLLEEVIASNALADSLKGHLLYWGLQRLVEARPAEALALMTPEMRRLISFAATGGVWQSFVQKALSQLSQDDPPAALAWFRENQEGMEPDVRRWAGWGLVAPLATGDLAAALRLVEELGLDRNVVPGLVEKAAESPEQRALALDVLREWREEDPKERLSRFANVFGKVLFDENAKPVAFEESVARIEKYQLSAEEIQIVVLGELSSHTNRFSPEDSGRWAEWLLARDVHESAPAEFGKFFKRWIGENWQSTEAWLQDAADGPAKDRCIYLFGDSVARHRPDLAREWFEKLPPGPERELGFRRLAERQAGKDVEMEDYLRAHGMR